MIYSKKKNHVCYVSLADNLRQDFTLIGQTSSVIQQMVFVSPLICQISKKKNHKNWLDKRLPFKLVSGILHNERARQVFSPRSFGTELRFDERIYIWSMNHKLKLLWWTIFPRRHTARNSRAAVFNGPLKFISLRERKVHLLDKFYGQTCVL